jgi:hypothetical protein
MKARGKASSARKTKPRTKKQTARKRR